MRLEPQVAMWAQLSRPRAPAPRDCPLPGLAGPERGGEMFSAPFSVSGLPLPELMSHLPQPSPAPSQPLPQLLLPHTACASWLCRTRPSS